MFDMDEDDEILQLFIQESREHLDGIVENLLQIEQNGADLDIELINQVFRTLHSIKGGAGFFTLDEVQNLAHVMESILDQFRNSKLTPTPEIVSVLLDSSDILTQMINDVDSSRGQDISESMGKLEAILNGNDSPAGGADIEQSASSTVEELPAEMLEPTAPLEVEASTGQVSSQNIEMVTESAPQEGLKNQTPSSDKPANSAARGKEQSIRVNIELLDKLMALAGELVLTRNELISSAASDEPALIQTSIQSVDAITSELQEAIMSTRMQTVGIVFNKFKRIVRDLSKQVGKSIDLKISGEDVDMDKTIIEAIGDPLTHLIRNSIDHGIETPKDRLAKGKSKHGSLQLHAYHAAGQVVIEIKDDGAGINCERVKQKALENRLHTAEELEQMSEKEVIRLIFKPGFSTAEKVTDISGRGVGMDVVQQNLSKVGGIIDMDSVLGQGTTIRIKLPLTLAIIPSLLMMEKNQPFAIPQINLVELVRIKPGDTRNRLEHIGDATVLRIRGEILPVIQLQDLLDFHSRNAETETNHLNSKSQTQNKLKHTSSRDSSNTLSDTSNGKAHRPTPINVVVVAAGEFKYGIIVDELLDSAEIAVKPLGKHFSQSREYAGATILGDGSVALILDIAGIREVLELRESHDVQKELHNDAEQENSQSDHQLLLLIENGENEHFAIPSQLVSRIEKVAASSVQQIGGHQAISYRQGILQLMPIDTISGCSQRPDSDSFYVVVFSVAGHEIGIAASQVNDIVNISSGIDDLSYRRPGIMGAFVLDNKIVQLIDPHELLELESPELSNSLANESITQDNTNVTILLVEDSPFFLKQIKTGLEKHGYNILTAMDGLEGLEVLEQNPDIQMIVSDIEMPRMNGLEMVKAIRSQERWVDLPVIAVTSLAGHDAESEGIAAGFSEYQVKLDHEKLIGACSRLIKVSPPEPQFDTASVG